MTDVQLYWPNNKRCENCDAELKFSRGDRRFCDSTCRVAFWRKKKRQAKEQAQGVTFSETSLWLLQKELSKRLRSWHGGVFPLETQVQDWFSWDSEKRNLEAIRGFELALRKILKKQI